MKTCNTCGEEKDDYEFNSCTQKETGREFLRNACKKCDYAKYKERKSDRELERRYGINRVQWELILKSQDNKCKLCGKEFGVNEKIHTDHDHKTMVVRGLLCPNCNHGLRYIENLEWTEKAIDYLRNSNALKELYP